MPEYSCKILTDKGQIVKANVESASRLSCIKKLRSNSLMPISVKPILKINLGKIEISKKKKFRNIQATTNRNRKKTKTSIVGSLNNILDSNSKKPSSRDLRVFTQNFYLLKKANFNNIHALSTVIETTENPRLKLVLEDILAGVEARRIYVYNNGILFRDIPIYIY